MNKESIKKISKVMLVEYEEGKLKLVVMNKDGSVLFYKKVTDCKRELGLLTIELEDEVPDTCPPKAGDHSCSPTPAQPACCRQGQGQGH